MSAINKFMKIWRYGTTGSGFTDEELKIFRENSAKVIPERSEHLQIVEEIFAGINETEEKTNHKNMRERANSYYDLASTVQDAIDIKLGLDGPRKADYEHKRIIHDLLDKGRESVTRAHYKDGVQAKTLSYDGELMRYDLSKNQLPLITLRPIATRMAFNEILWIYQDASNDLNLLRDKYGVTWWDEWDIGDRTIGMAYGAVVKKYDLMHRLLDELQKDPDGRRHVMSLWQDEVFMSDAKYGLPPCCFMTMWNVRHEEDGDYLDMSLTQRSSDFCLAGIINEMQYVGLQYMVARHCGFKPGVFNHFIQNIHVYDRHISGMLDLEQCKPINCEPKIWLNPDKTDFYSFTPEDIKVIDYPIDKIKAQNPQITLFKEQIAV